MGNPRTGACITAAFVAALANAQGAQEFERVDLRVVSTADGGTVVVDRGRREGIAKSDIVFFYPRGGGSYRGVVISVDDRSAVVEMQQREVVPRPGTRGRVRVPKSRFKLSPAKPKPKPQPDPTPRPRDAEPGPQPERPRAPDPDRSRWQNKDEDWQAGMPLLQMKPVRPKDRGMQMSGRVYSFGSLAWDDSQDFNSSFFRLGTEFEVQNPFNQGGGIHFDAEFDNRVEQNEQRGVDLLVRRASYYGGGTRFDELGFEVGRFLHNAMPEFGVVDGIEVGFRTREGQRFGGSIGFLPELDDDFDTGQDLQFSAYYRWVADNSERFMVAGGFQKSFHNGKTDRDLLVIKSHYIPLEAGWNLYGTAWIDFYYGRDDEKGSGPELTQAFLSANRTLDNGDSLEFYYRRIRFPEILRNEFRPLQPGEVADNRYDRVGVLAETDWSEATRLFADLSGYDDEEDTGGALELGGEVRDLLASGSMSRFTVFGALAEETNTIGGRLLHSRPTDTGQWDVFYEVANHRLQGFPSDRDDLIQHRLRGSRSIHTDSGWSVELWAEGHLFDEELAFVMGFHVQRSFRLSRTY